MIGFYFKSALRGIQRKKIFSVLNIAGLALGICIFLLTLEYYSYETGFNRFHQNLANLYRVNVTSPEGKSPSTFPAIAPLMQQSIPGVKAAVRFADNFNSGAIVSYQPNNEAAKQVSFREERCVFVDKQFLDAFTFPFIEGNNQLDNANTVVITLSSAKKIFGKESAIGKTIQLHNQFGVLPCKVTGVIADPPLQNDINFDYLFSIEALKNPAYTIGSDWAKLDSWSNNSYTTFIWIDSQSDPVKMASIASDLWVRNYPGYKKEDGKLSLQPVRQIHLGQSFKDDNPVYGSRAMVYFVLGLGILVLCIAWINYINFSTAHALSQAREIGIHKIIGSERKQIVFRYILESMLLNFAGLLLAFFLIGIIQSLFSYLTARPLSLEYINHWQSWLISSTILVMGIVVCGGYVGWILSKFKPMAAIRFNDIGQIGNTLLRKGLVVFQFVVSILFISATIIAYRQIGFMKHHDLGMNIDNLVVIDGPAIKDSSIKTSAKVFTNEIARLPFVEKFSSTGSLPGIDFAHNFGMDGVTRQNPDKGDEKKNYFASEVDEHYFNLYEIPVSYGRSFTSDEADKGFKAGKLILNETAVRTLGLKPETALHNFIQWNDKQWEIVGIIRDYHHRSLKEKIEPIIYIPLHSSVWYSIKMNPDHFSQKMAAIKSIYEKIFPSNPFGYKILKEAYDTQYADEQRSGTIVLSISVLVVFIACLGLIGLSVFTAKRRSKEIGVRKILGASAGSLFALLSKDFLFLVLVAFLIASPIGWTFMTKWLQGFAYRVSISWWVFALSGLAAVIIALFTISFQTVKAAITNPVNSLRN